MNLERIELHGFKSFADKTVIPLKDGFTAIIGPNGCGKSNVAEAIRWTLGEQSAKSLRGKNMQDVIFAGTEKRRSMSYCEVTLVFNNSGHRIFKSLPFDEVSITRKLDRSGLSEYSINNTRCRMKDIINLLHDTGIGKEGYSIIGQGRIDEILSAKPEDRRNIFEEAAGISKFRAQREESERKLEKTALNLSTANEVIAEIERQLTPLRRQAETAKKYFELKDALKSQEVNLYIYNYENNESIKKNINDKLSASIAELSAKDAAFNGCSAEYDSALSESAELTKRYEDNVAELLALKVDEQKSAGKASLLQERIANLQSECARLNEELKSTDSQLVVSDNLIKAAKAKQDDEVAAYVAADKEYESLSKKLAFVSQSLAGQESELESKNDEYIRAMQELGTLKSNYSSYVAEKGINDERSKNLLALINGKKAKLDEELTNLTIYDSKLKSAKEQMRGLIAEYNETLSTKQDAAESIKGLDEDVVGLNSKLGLAEGHLNLQLKIKEEYASYYEPVKHLMQDAKNDPVLREKILGVTAEVISVPKEYESAIDYALGGHIQCVLTESERDVASIITYLKQKNYKRVTFRPRTACSPRPVTPEQRAALKEQGVFGLASDLVSCAPEFKDFINSFLASTIIVDNMYTAERIIKQYGKIFKIVTVDGEVYERSGDITGGSRREQTSGLLSQEQAIEQSRQNLDRIKRNIALMKEERGNREREIEICDDKIKELNEKIGELRIEITLNEEKSKQAFATVEELKKEIAEEADEYEQVKAQLSELETKLSSIDELEGVVKSRQSEYGQLLTASKSQKGETTSERETLNTQVMELKVVRAQHKSAVDTYEAELFRLKREAEVIQEEKLDLIADLKTAENALENIRTAPEKESFSEEDLKRIKELDALIAGISERKKELSDRIVELDRDKQRLFQEKDDITQRKVRYEGMLERVDDENRFLQEHILEDYNLTYSSALPLKDEEFNPHGAKTAISDLKKDISKLGEVNPLAVETLQETEQRHEECVTQRDDIQAAYDDIFKIIEELTGEMKDKFVGAFEKIQENFKDVFTQLFGGGKGDLKLDFTDTDDPLEAGIEIFAQPPGKALKHISLLSGGERALTAISILFAILKLKPMPFCVLDEIEAALDDSNANLFAEFLKRFSDYTQFIVITHRKPTMRHADSIFGITMEEKGVTKVVAIEFEDAVKYASDASGSSAGEDAANEAAANV